MQLEELINQTVEFEGLLRVLRDRKAPGVRALVEMKFHSLCSDFEAYLAEEPKAGPALAQGTITFPDRQPAAEPTPVAPTVEEVAVEIETEAGSSADTEPEILEIDVHREATPTPETEAAVTAPVEPVEPEAQPAVTAQVVPPPFARPESVNDDLLRAFTVNDRFMFIRELFGGNADDFAQTVKLLAAMPDLTEAQEYLYQDLMWDSSNPAVSAFMDVLARHLPARVN